jgi:hypothetical protein
MATPADEASAPAGFEPVHVELDWYDGPRRGLADVNGSAHYFQGVYDYHETEPDEDSPYSDYFVWPVSETGMAMEREQYVIFAEWRMCFEAGTANTDTHPVHGGINSRYDELETLLASHRTMPELPRRLTATWHWGSRTVRYPLDGPIYWVRWSEPDR